MVFPSQTETSDHPNLHEQPRSALFLGIMAKYWCPGRVKSRLGRAIGMEQSAIIHRVFTSFLCDQLSGAADFRQICFSPDTCESRFTQELPLVESSPWQLIPQGDGDLGLRMSRWFERILVDSADRAMLIGADCPTLGPDIISRCGEELRENELVICPAKDGGYVLIGLRGPWNRRFESLFRDIPWSTNEVLSLTCDRAAKEEIHYKLLEVAEDVDTVEELDRLCDLLRQSSKTEYHQLLENINSVRHSELNQ